MAKSTVYFLGTLALAIIANELMLIIACWVANELTLYYPYLLT